MNAYIYYEKYIRHIDTLCSFQIANSFMRERVTILISGFKHTFTDIKVRVITLMDIVDIDRMNVNSS